MPQFEAKAKAAIRQVAKTIPGVVRLKWEKTFDFYHTEAGKPEKWEVKGTVRKPSGALNDIVITCAITEDFAECEVSYPI